MAGQIIEVPGQGEIEFPADMPDDQIAAAIKRIQLSPMQKRMGLGKTGDTMGDIHRARDNAVYEVGGKVTDLTGSPFAGSMANAAADAATDPLTYLGGAFGKAMKPLAEAGGRNLMQSALKPGKFSRESGDAAKAVQTLLDEGVNVTEGGVAKLTDKIDLLDERLGNAISASKAKLLKTDVLQRLRDVVKDYRAGLDAEPNVATIREQARKLIEHPDSRFINEMSVQEAQAMKRQNYKELGDKAYGIGLKPAAERDAKKAITRGLKEEIERAVPEAGAVNAEMSPLINARDLAQERVLLAGNKNPISFGAFGLANPATLLAWLADRSELGKSILARFLHSGVAPSTTSIGAATGGMGSIIDRRGQQ
jgi:hypothetical protein